MTIKNYGIQFANSKESGRVNPVVAASLNEAKRVALEHSKIYKRFAVRVIGDGVIVACYQNGRLYKTCNKDV